MNIYISGSLAYDRIMTFPGKFSDHILPDKLHILNVCFLVDRLEEKFGGTAGNIAYSLALMGEKPMIMAAVGRDFDRYQRRLDRLGLPLDGLTWVEDELTAGAYITTDAKDNQITGFNPGAMKRRAEFAGLDGGGKSSLGIISPGNAEDMVGYARRFRELGVPYIFDPGQQIPALSAEGMLEAITGSLALVSNDYELEMISRAVGKNWRELLEFAGAVITTLGGEGSLVRMDGREVRVPAFKVDKAVDPTGAGDAYRAGLLKGLALGRDLVAAAAMGSACASFCVERHGTQEHAFTEEELQARIPDVA
ncbi:MAG: carbohydrate kinase family protein [Desulfovibrionaceae bacterium]